MAPGTAAKAARWLGYSDWEQFLDKRNDAPIAAPYDEEEPETYLDATVAPEIPKTVDLAVEVPELVGFEGRQAHHLVLIGEKSSLEPALAPIARRFNAHLYLPTGEISDTLIYSMARDAAEDGRRMIVFYFTDADPSGWQMGVSVARKLQVFKVGWFPDLDFELRRVALTPKQVHELGLRLTPLKEKEKRRHAWAAQMDLWAIDEHGNRVPGGAEIDALTIPKREAAFRQMVIDAVAPFYDDTLADRTREALAEWRREVENLIDEQIDRTAWDAAKADAEARLQAMRDEIDTINATLADATPAIDFPEIVLPDPELDVQPNGSPLIDSDWSFAEQTARLIAEKRYE